MTKYIIPILASILLVACNKAPDPKIALLETRLAKLEFAFNETGKLNDQYHEIQNKQANEVYELVFSIDTAFASKTDVEKVKKQLSDFIRISLEMRDIHTAQINALNNQVFNPYNRR